MRIDKDYERSFLLEPTKLTRLVETMHERLEENEPDLTQDKFEVFLPGGRHEELVSLDSVLALENSGKRKIQRLIVTSSASIAGDVRPVHEIHVDFGRLITFSSGKTKGVTVTVSSTAPGWASRAFAQVEEQVERTWGQVGQSVTALSVLVVATTLVLLFLLVSTGGTKTKVDVKTDGMWLTDADSSRVRQLLKQNPTLSDEHVREIFTRQLRNVVGGVPAQPSQPAPKPDIVQIAFVAVPLLVVLGCGIYLLTACYPRQVFLWGDEVDRFNNLIHRRRALWGVVIGVLVVGLLSKALYEGALGPWGAVPHSKPSRTQP